MGRDRRDTLITNRGFRKKIYNENLRDGVLYCQCCGKPIVDGDFELHHILPMGQGGKDVETNIVLLCHNCHYKLHNLKRAEDILHDGLKASHKKGGRPRKYVLDDKAEEVLKKYFAKEIDEKEVKKALGVAATSHIADLSMTIEFKRKYHIDDHGGMQTGRPQRTHLSA